MPSKRSMHRSAIAPPPARGSVPVSVRLPEDLHGQIAAYAAALRSDRSYVIVECLRRALASDPGAPAPRARRKASRARAAARPLTRRARRSPAPSQPQA